MICHDRKFFIQQMSRKPNKVIALYSLISFLFETGLTYLADNAENIKFLTIPLQDYPSNVVIITETEFHFNVIV